MLDKIKKLFLPIMSVIAPHRKRPQKFVRFNQEVIRFAVCASRENIFEAISDAEERKTTPGKDVEKITKAVRNISRVLIA